MTEPPKRVAKTPEPTQAPHNGAELYAAYRGHSNALRTWLVAYGIGGPVFILSQDKLWATLAKSGLLPTIALLFLAGVALQVVLAAINKSAMWACYYGTEITKFQATKRYKMASWLSERYQIDLICDLVAMCVFAWATYLCFISLAGQAGI